VYDGEEQLYMPHAFCTWTKQLPSQREETGIEKYEISVYDNWANTASIMEKSSKQDAISGKSK